MEECQTLGISPTKLKNSQFFVAGSAAQIYAGPETAVSPAPEKPVPALIQFSTQTVYGFLDFTTTIGNTVMVFSPQSAPAGS